MKKRILPRKGWRSAILLACLLMPWKLVLAQGIPEPSLIFYGTIRNSAVLNARVTEGELVWRIEKASTGRTVTRVTTLTNVLGQFSYVLEIPCETIVTGQATTNVLELTPASTLFDQSQITVDGIPASFVVVTQATFTASSRDRGRMERVDLTISAPCDDFDGNGICDDWEDQYFGFIGVDPNDDEDGDGMSNRDEYLAGTHPIEADDFFGFLSATSELPEGFRLEWMSKENRSYSLLRGTSFSPSNFEVIRSNIVSTPPINVMVDTNLPSAGPYFYLLRLEL